jgi:HPt (histidine-containing phosphotransfer) domain-containing protein
MEPDKEASLKAAVDALWRRFQPEMGERVTVLEAAAQALAADALSPAQREQAHAAAHKLAGSLGSFGLTRGTVLARELEIVYSREDGPDPAAAAQLTQIAAELRSLVEGRPQG